MAVSPEAKAKREAQRYRKLAALCTGDGCYQSLDLFAINQALAAGEAVDCPHCGRHLWRP